MSATLMIYRTREEREAALGAVDNRINLKKKNRFYNLKNGDIPYNNKGQVLNNRKGFFVDVRC